MPLNAGSMHSCLQAQAVSFCMDTLPKTCHQLWTWTTTQQIVVLSLLYRTCLSLRHSQLLFLPNLRKAGIKPNKTQSLYFTPRHKPLIIISMPHQMLYRLNRRYERRTACSDTFSQLHVSEMGLSEISVIFRLAVCFFTLSYKHILISSLIALLAYRLSENQQSL